MKLTDIQKVQESFDKTRGFTFDPFIEQINNLSIDHLDEVLQVQYTTLAMSGEVGELANKVKKHARAMMLGNKDIDFDDCYSEMADIFAYLLKLSNIFKEDLSIHYLEVICKNSIRFPTVSKSYKHIVTLASLQEHLNSSLAEKIRCKHSNLTVYIRQSGTITPSLTRSQTILNSISKQLEFLKENSTSQLIILDQDPGMLALINSKHLYKQGVISRPEYEEILLKVVELEIYLGEMGYLRTTLQSDKIISEANETVNNLDDINEQNDKQSNLNNLFKNNIRTHILDYNMLTPEEVLTSALQIIAQLEK